MSSRAPGAPTFGREGASLVPVRLSLGFSSCPNDTFMFHQLVHGGAPGMTFDVTMDDIEGLNRRAEGPPEHRLDVTKVSVGTWGRIADDYALLEAGAALGRGCGPLVVRRSSDGPETLEDLGGCRVAVPGLGTTAYLLLRLFAPRSFEPVVMRFDAILSAVAAGTVDAGLIIHESRFTYPGHGLVEVADLGVRWETDTGLPLPLGVIVARRSIAPEVRQGLSDALRASVEHAWRDPSASWGYIRQHAQELDEDVCRRHIDLYVNPFSAALGPEGHAAIEALLGHARNPGEYG